MRGSEKKKTLWAPHSSKTAPVENIQRTMASPPMDGGCQGGREEGTRSFSFSLSRSFSPSHPRGREGWKEGGREGAKEQEWERQRGKKGNLRIEKRNDSWREGLAERPEAGILEAE